MVQGFDRHSQPRRAVCVQRHVVAGVLLLLMSRDAFAQQAPHVCGAGPGSSEDMAGVQAAGPGGAPTPLCYWKPEVGSQQTALQMRWADRWGAIADDGKGVSGIVSSMHSKQQAEKSAISECRKRGGGACAVALTYHNQCAAVTRGEHGASLYHAEAKDKAVESAMKNCETKQGAGACRLYYSGCSLPEQVQ